MDSVIATAASGMRSRMETLDVLANNIANAGTTGYKADQESYGLYFGDPAWEGYDEGRPDAAEMPVLERNWTDFSQGTLLPTGSATDVALASSGFFMVDGANGPLYTRNGHFRLSKTGVLQTQDGYPVKATDGSTITLSLDSAFQITPTGDIQQNGSTVARVAVMDAPGGKSGERVGAGYFKFAADATPTPVTDPQIEQGKIETSNVVPAYSAVKLVTVMRSFEMLQKAVSMTSEMNRKVVEEVAKVAS
ncbi:MAG: flagellar hook-basal body protein [Bryobacteraceae bacterium]